MPRGSSQRAPAPRRRGIPTPQGTVAGTVASGSLFDVDTDSDTDMGGGGSLLSDVETDSDSDVSMADNHGGGDGNGESDSDDQREPSGGGEGDDGGSDYGAGGGGPGGGPGGGDSSDHDSTDGDSSAGHGGYGGGGGGSSDSDEAGDAGESDNDSEDENRSGDESEDDDGQVPDPEIPKPYGPNPSAQYRQVHNACLTYQRALEDRKDDFKRLLDERGAKIRQLKTKNKELRDKIKTLEARVKKAKPRPKKTERTWQDTVRGITEEIQERRQAPSMAQWESVCKASNREENMSTVVINIHPDIELVAPTDDRRPHLMDPYTGLQPQVPMIGDHPLDFLGLPLKAQAQIFRLWLHKEGQLIHCMSRLDPFVCPVSFPSAEELQGSSGLPKRFYWGSRYFSLSKDGQKPNDTLRLLLVSRHFHYMGTYCFYGLNTFAFSSLGELFRFTNGIGPARLDRIQHIEITWIGNQYLTAVPPKEGKPTPFSVRTHALCWLPEAHRLRTIVFHINESGKSYIRRQYESIENKQWMAAKTAGQPNYRQTRSFRTIQGMDYIYTLRGMTWIRFYDYEKALKPQPNQVSYRVPIRDWSFHEDITNVTTMDKVPIRKRHAELENLTPFFRDREADEPQVWEPSTGMVDLVKEFFAEYQGQGAYDMLRQNPAYRDIDFTSRIGTAGPRTNGTSGPRTEPSSSGSDSPGPSPGPGGGGHGPGSDTPSTGSESGGDEAPGGYRQPFVVTDSSDSDTDMEDAGSISLSVAGSAANPIPIDSSDESDGSDDDDSSLFVRQPRGESPFSQFLRAQQPVWIAPNAGSAKSDE